MMIAVALYGYVVLDFMSTTFCKRLSNTAAVVAITTETNIMKRPIAPERDL